ncbi:NADPH-dependent FMN reductase [Chryseobacterium sp. MDT2-18]|uniref:NADPH-dependent FMN reductase n=1 Tax=Chryseobacterium sp. MDT2-18 TaxID=1259136 RepID=UPI0027830E83|nr:NADPH-dependent FMN reductase [Chryseobacterium sp. MDT2-18]MDQ0475756.1 chromate reductase [Chryseobacterium sp. MDT2-18]
MMEKKIAVLVGSLRKESFNRKIANELIRLAPKTLKMEMVEIGNLPLYNEDLDTNPPKEWTDFREIIQNSDAVLFVSPEYNRTIPGGLKNAIDVGSRPPGKSAWKGKSGAVVTVSPGATGGLGSNHNIRQAVVFLDIPMMQQPEAYIGKVHELLREDGKTVIEKTETFLRDYMLAFEKWVNLF